MAEGSPFRKEITLLISFCCIAAAEMLRAVRQSILKDTNTLLNTHIWRYVSVYV